MPKRKARSRLKPATKATTGLTSTKLNLKPIRIKSLKLETLNSKFETRNTKYKIQNAILHRGIKLPTVNPKLFSFSLLLYFLFFLFLDQVPPEKVADIPLYRAYLPFQLFLFIANLSLLMSFLDQKLSLAVAFFIQALFFFKLQGFEIEWRLVSSLAVLSFGLWLLGYLWQKLKLSRKVKSLKPPKITPRQKRRRRPRSRLAR